MVSARRCFVLIGTGILGSPAMAQQDTREKEAVTVRAPERAQLVAAILDAAREPLAVDKPAFKISSYSADSGVVRLFEEHVKKDTLEKGFTYTYCSQTYVGAGYTGCSQATTEFHPTIVDDRGMVVTWRLVSFRSIGNSEFRVLLQRWEKDQNGFATTDKKERETFYNILNNRLKGIRRGANTGALADASDRAAGGDGVSGTYHLVSINGQALPQPSAYYGTIAGGTYVLQPTGEFISVMNTTPNPTTTKGKYTMTGTKVMLSGGRALILGSIQGDTLAFAIGGQKMLFLRR